MELLYYLLLFIISYTLGSFPTAYLLVKKVMGKDIRKFETGNVGAMNTARITGKFYYFLIVLIVDAFKGFSSLMIAGYLVDKGFIHLPASYMIAAFGAVLGHCYSLYFKIKDGQFAGGKAVATMAGVLLYLNWLGLLIPEAFVMLLIILLSKNLFASQFFGALALPIVAWLFAPQYVPLMIICIIPALCKQWPRVIPMFQGKEPKLYWGKKKKI